MLIMSRVINESLGSAHELTFFMNLYTNISSMLRKIYFQIRNARRFHLKQFPLKYQEKRKIFFSRKHTTQKFVRYKIVR